MMKSAVVIGLGQPGRVLAGGFLRCGYQLLPVNRGDDMKSVARTLPDPELVLVAVAETAICMVLLLRCPLSGRAVRL
ncbi:MAG: hypothetical protein WBX11_04770 [Thiobacillaceae bacterium]|jgi:hypothetical protein